MCAALASYPRAADEAFGTQHTTLRVGQVVASRTIDDFDDTYTLVKPSYLARVGDTLAVADAGNRRVVLFDAKTLRPILTFGTVGSGPGEFRRPSYLTATAEGYAIGDPTLSRATLVDREGKLLRTAVLPERRAAEWIVEMGDGSFLMSARSNSHYALRGRLGSTLSNFGPRPQRTPAVSRQDQAQSLEDIDLLALSPDGSVYVLDNTFGMLVRYDQRGGQSGQWTLPGPYRDSILASREGLRRANPGVVYIGYPFAVTLHTMPDGRLFMFRSLSVFLVGVVFDPRTERFVTLAQDGSHRTLDLARGAYFDGSFLTVVHDDGLRMFDTRPQSR